MPIVTVTFFPCNICPGDICPYKQYFSCYWPNSDQTLRVVPGTLYFNCNGHICPGNIGPGKICHIINISDVTDPILTTFWVQFLEEAMISFDQIFLDQILFDPDLHIFLDTKFEPKLLLTHNCLDPNCFGPTFFGT